MRARLRDVAEASAADPKKALLNALADRHLGIHMMGARVLVATYIEPDKTAGGIIKPDSAIAENRFQGKGALVLRLGPMAFKEDSVTKFEGITADVGDWVMVRPSDGMEIFTVDPTGRAGVSCRVFDDTRIIARLDDPALIY